MGTYARNILRMQPKIDEITGNPIYPSDEKLYDKANAMFGIRKKSFPKRIVPPKEYYNKQRYKFGNIETHNIFEVRKSKEFKDFVATVRERPETLPQCNSCVHDF